MKGKPNVRPRVEEVTAVATQINIATSSTIKLLTVLRTIEIAAHQTQPSAEKIQLAIMPAVATAIASKAFHRPLVEAGAQCTTAMTTSARIAKDKEKLSVVKNVVSKTKCADLLAC